jgi:hypothetical protein
MARQRRPALADCPEFLASLDTRWNVPLDPTQITLGCGRKLWWRCAKGHIWFAAVIGRAQGRGCPFCAGVRVAPERRLSAVAPELAKQWHPTKNGSLSPDGVSAVSNKRVWWRCPEGPDHEWQAIVAIRGPCPFCRGRRVSTLTSFATRDPELARLWHPTKNGLFTPETVLFTSKDVWSWRCANNPHHEWTGKISEQKQCRICCNIEDLQKNSISMRAPELARLWHPEKNGSSTAGDFVITSSKKVWWRCPEGPDHEWKASICARQPCPFCFDNRVSITNCLATVAPELAQEWHPKRNGQLSPRDIRASSMRAVYWSCPEDPMHEWSASPRARLNGRGLCQYCHPKQPSLKGPPQATRVTLAMCYPEIARDWHPIKNGSLTPTDVSPTSSVLVYWRCPNGHAERASPLDRVSSNGRCRRCAMIPRYDWALREESL